MTYFDKLARGVRMAGIGYLFLYLEVNLNFFGWTLPLLPNSVGWALHVLAIRALAGEVPTLALLSPFAAALAVWNLGQFVPALELPGWLGWLSVLMGIIQLYFHFQLLTDLAGLAGRYRQALGARDFSGQLLRGRTVLTVSGALMFLPSLMAALPQWLMLLLLIFGLGAGLLCTSRLLSLAAALTRYAALQKQPPLDAMTP